MGEQLELFRSSLPTKPYATDNLKDGLKIQYKQVALVKKYIQHNPPAKIHWLVMDCDFRNGLEVASEKNLPVPNLTVINRDNGHSHLFYGLAVAVVRTDMGREKPLRYLASVEYALRTALGADAGYMGLISKNPLHPEWLVYESNPNLYELGTLADYLTLPTKLPAKALQVGIGRNCSLFDVGRRWAYDNVLNARLTGNRDGFHSLVREALHTLNQFPVPLPAREVDGIAKSIARWTWKNYTKQWTDGEFPKYRLPEHAKEKGYPDIGTTLKSVHKPF